MKLWVIRDGDRLAPYGNEAMAEFDKVPRDKPLQAEVKQPRNPRFHRLFWALAARIGQGIGKDAEWVERAFKIETGHVDFYDYGGKTHMLPRSIAFQSMDELAFRSFFNACVDVAYRVWGVDPASVADLLVPEESQKR